MGAYEPLLKMYNYMCSEYFNFGDTLVGLLLRYFPWFSKVIDNFRRVSVVLTYKSGSMSYKMLTITRNTLSLFLYTALKSAKGEIPSNLLDPIFIHIRNSMPVLLEHECLARLIYRSFFLTLDSLARDMEKPEKFRKKLSKEKDRKKLLEKLREDQELIQWAISCIEKSAILNEIPEVEKMEVRQAGFISLRETGFHFPVFSVDFYEPFYPRKYALRAGYYVLEKGEEYLDKLRQVAETGWAENIEELEAFLGTCVYASTFLDFFRALEFKWGNLAPTKGTYNIYKKLEKEYVKARGKPYVKMKDLRMFFCCVGAFLC